jgi:hypothetical protein
MLFQAHVYLWMCSVTDIFAIIQVKRAVLVRGEFHSRTSVLNIY